MEDWGLDKPFQNLEMLLTWPPLRCQGDVFGMLEDRATFHIPCSHSEHLHVARESQIIILVRLESKQTEVGEIGLWCPDDPWKIVLFGQMTVMRSQAFGSLASPLQELMRPWKQE